MQEPKIILEFSFKKQTQTKIDNIIFFPRESSLCSGIISCKLVSNMYFMTWKKQQWTR